MFSKSKYGYVFEEVDVQLALLEGDGYIESARCPSGFWQIDHIQITQAP